MAGLFKRRKKASENDYTPSMLPQNRRQVFFDVLKLQWVRFLGHGGSVLIFAAPMLLLALTEDSYRADIMKALESATESERLALYHDMLSMSNTRAILNILGFLLLSVCIAGLIRVIRQYAWEENVAFSAEFFRGIKQNARAMLPLGLLVGVVNALCVYTYNLSLATNEGLMSVMLVIPTALAVLFGIPLAAYCAVCISIYDNGLAGDLKMALLVFAKAPLKTYLALVCCFLPFAPQLIPNVYCHIFGGIVGCVVTPLVMLAWFLFASDRLDEHINKEHFPSLVGKGTFQGEDKDGDKGEDANANN